MVVGVGCGVWWGEEGGEHGDCEGEEGEAADAEEGCWGWGWGWGWGHLGRWDG